MNVYDTAYSLAYEIKKTPEFAEFTTAKQLMESDEDTFAMVKRFQKLQFQFQAQAMNGLGDEKIGEQVKKLGELLSYNENAMRYLTAQYKVQVIVNDIYKIISEAAQIDLDIFN